MKVGLASTTITPTRPIWMAGYAARTEPSAGAYNDLEASAIVFDNGDARVGIMALDLIGIDEFLLEPIRDRAAALGIPSGGMLVNCSHTHCGPACRRVRGSCQEFDDEYLADLRDTLCSLLEDAASAGRESRLDYTVGSCTLGVNRRKRAADGTYAGMLPAPDKPVDQDVPVMRVVAPDGKVRAVLFSYACHPTTMGGQLLGTDYPGFARDVVRERMPGCVPIFLQGCGGDVKPRNVTGEGTFASGPIEVVREIGHELGRAVLTALCGEPTRLGESLAGASAVAELPTRGDPTDEELEALANGNEWERAWAEAVRETIAEKGGLAKAIPIEVQALRIGGLFIVGMGGEVSCEIGLQLKDELRDLKLCTLGYSNLLRCYVASSQAHSEGGYEVDRSFLYSVSPEPKPLGLSPDSVGVLIGKAIEVTRALC